SPVTALMLQRGLAKKQRLPTTESTLMKAQTFRANWPALFLWLSQTTHIVPGSFLAPPDGRVSLRLILLGALVQGLIGATEPIVVLATPLLYAPKAIVCHMAEEPAIKTLKLAVA